MEKKKICSNCGKIIGFNETCSCKTNKEKQNKYKRDYYEKNKERHKLLNSPRWKRLRKVIIDRDGGCCQRCLVKYGVITSARLQVHHIKPRNKYPELMFVETNLITLCSTCNEQLGTNEKLDFEPRVNQEDNNIDYHL